MTETQIAWLALACGPPLVVFLVGLLDYRIDDRHVRCYWGPIPVRKFAIEDIRDAERGFRHMSESWANTLWIPTLRRKGVTLHRRTGGFKRAVITPDDPDAFIARVKSHPRYRGEVAR